MATRRPARRNRAGEATRQRILSATMDLVAEFGYSSLTLSNIAASADVTLSSVRNLSPNTGDLLAEAMEQSLLAWRETTPNSKPWEDAASREERVRCRLQVAADRARDSLPIWWRVGMIVSLLDKSDEVPAQRVFARVHKESELELRDLLHKLAPDAVAEQPMLLNTLAGMFMAIIDGMWLGRRAAPDADYSFLVALLAPALLRVVDNWAAQAPLVMEQLTTAEPDTAARRLARPASSADSRARLIEAAARLAAERGFRGATIEAICQRAGTPVGSLYWHFQDKSDLFDRVIQESIAAGAAEHPVVGTGESWEQAVQAWLVRTSLWMQPQRAPYMRIGFMLLHEGWEGGVAARENFLSARSDRRNAFEQWLATLLPEDRVSQELLSALGQLALVLSDGYLFVQLVEPDGVSAKAFSEFASSLLAAVVEEAQLGPQAPEDSGSPLALTKTR